MYLYLIGSYSNCEKLKKTSTIQTHSEIFYRSFLDATKNSNSDVINVKSASSTNNTDGRTILEQLPNELFLYLFTYLNIDHLYNAFWGLNIRMNSLFQSYESLCLTFDDKTDRLLMKSYAPYITRLIIDTSIECDLTQFTNLQTLILCDGNLENLEQIQPHTLPNLTRLSFLLGSKFIPSSELTNNIFSNKFPSLHHANLGQINDLDGYTWSTSPSLRFVSIRSDKPLIVSCILASCPNLDHLQLHVFNEICIDAVSSPPSNHPLRRFTLWSDSIELTATDIGTLLVNTPNVQYFYLQTISVEPFIDLANVLIDRLNHLSRFDCHVKEMMTKETRIDELAIVHQLHPSFNRIKCIEENNDFRIFATE